MNHSNHDNQKVSIIVPVYNVERYVERCLRSIIAQNYKLIEIIVINDGSTDNSGKICDEIAATDNRIRVIHQENKGLSEARNVGIRYSSGKYVCFVDSDDMISEYFVECMVEVARKTNAQIVQCSVEAFINEKDLSKAVPTGHYSTYYGKDMCLMLLQGAIRDSGVVQNKLYQKNLFDDLKFRIGMLHEDEFITYRLFYKSNTIAVLADELYYYQSKRMDSITHARYTLKRLDAVVAAEEKCMFFCDNKEYELYDNAINAYCRCLLDNVIKLKQSDLENKKKVIGTLRMKLWNKYPRLLFSPYISLRRKLGVIKLGLRSLF